MSAYKPPAQTILPWLKANLGPCALAPLTGTDTRALRAAVQIIEHFSYDSESEVLKAYATMVGRMQPHTQELAYHAIAHVMDWSDRAKLWAEAGLPEFQPRLCAFEPGGGERRAA